MRIERLDLLAFGPFTDLSLPLGAPGVHIVYGPNEAGKSTALRALHDLFYKIPKQTPYDFVHDKPDMKLRAVVRSDDGRVVEFVRHKRDKNSLTDPRGNPLDESVVQRLLGGVSSSTFLSMFALTLEELERGGESLLEGGGDVGEALLSARAYPQLRALVERLRKQRDALFRPQGRRGPTINKELGEYQDLNRRIGEAQLRIADYRRRLAAVAEQRQREKDLDQKLASLREEQKRWTALQQALPALHTRAQQVRRIAELEAEGPLAPLDFADRLPRLEEQSRAAEETLADSTAELAAKQEELDRLVVDARLLDAAPEVERLARSRERIEADEERLAALERQAARLREEAREILQEVRPDPAGRTVPRCLPWTRPRGTG
ncbi:ATP-binding protein [Thermobifida fusca]|uniref:ATP-binding protein n=1 Tax=Thermobifida fusca TaxID=2021 RepID=UPI00039CC255|nr:AAA family ATPase [Thermobifida fusca]